MINLFKQKYKTSILFLRLIIEKLANDLILLSIHIGGTTVSYYMSRSFHII